MVAMLLLLAQVAATAVLASDAQKLTFSEPRLVMELDAGKLKGTVRRLSWLGPQEQLYLRVSEMDRWNNERPKHYLLPLAGGEPAATDGEPAGASSYWASKSAPVAPGVPSLRFDVSSQQENKTATGSTKEAPGVPNPFRSDPTSSQIAADVASMQRVTTTTLRLKGELIVEAKNESLAPGLTFGWGPPASGLLAFADSKRRLTVIDREGKKVEVAGAVDAVLPAWSPDGKRIAYLQKKGGKKYALMIVDVQ